MFCSYDYDLDVVGIVSFIMCIVIVSDGDLKDIVLLVVIINDVNDNMFIFGSFVYIFYVSLVIGVGIVLGFIVVFDVDIGVFGLFYCL